MQQPKILVADDSRSVRAVLRRTLAAAGYDVILASDGLEAVRSAQRDHPDLVILDIQMPEMDGYTACEEILSLEESPAGLPIVFLTRDTAKHLNVLGTQLGAYLPKPVTDETLLSTISGLLATRPQRDTVTSTPTCVADLPGPLCTEATHAD